MSDAVKRIDLAFILRDCGGDIAAAQRRIDKALAPAVSDEVPEIKRKQCNEITDEEIEAAAALACPYIEVREYHEHKAGFINGVHWALKRGGGG